MFVNGTVQPTRSLMMVRGRHHLLQVFHKADRCHLDRESGFSLDVATLDVAIARTRSRCLCHSYVHRERHIHLSFC
jgi:hypothetical protein